MSGGVLGPWRTMGSWTKINTEVEDVVSHGIIKGAFLSYAIASTYAIRTIGEADYLFIQQKISYSQYAEKPVYIVYVRAD
jgi:hypothetical protein